MSRRRGRRRRIWRRRRRRGRSRDRGEKGDSKVNKKDLKSRVHVIAEVSYAYVSFLLHFLQLLLLP